MSIIELTENLGGMEEYEPLPNGVYNAELQNIELRSNEKTPNGFLTCYFRIAPSEYPADYDAANAPEGVLVTHGYTPIPDPTNRRTVRPFRNLLEALGVRQDGKSFNPSDWIGRQVQLLITRGEYRGALVNNVEAITSIPRV